MESKRQRLHTCSLTDFLCAAEQNLARLSCCCLPPTAHRRQDGGEVTPRSSEQQRGARLLPFLTTNPITTPA